MTTADADTPSQEAVIVVDPAVAPVTVPSLLTEAMPVLALLHEIVRLASVFPVASFTAADAFCVSPIATEMDEGVIATEATEGGVTGGCEGGEGAEGSFPPHPTAEIQTGATSSIPRRMERT